MLVQRLDGERQVGINAELTGDTELFFNDLSRGKIGIFEQRQGGGLRVAATGADGADAFFGFEYITVTGNDQRCFAVCDQQHRFQPAQQPVCAPVFSELDRCAQQIALVGFQFGFETL